MHITHWDQAAVWSVVLQGGWLAPEAGTTKASEAGQSVEKIPHDWNHHKQDISTAYQTYGITV